MTREDPGGTPPRSRPQHLHDAMEHIQHLTATWLRKPDAPAARVDRPAPPSLPDREQIRKVAELHHRQLVNAKRTDGSHFEVLKAQTEALRQFTLQLPPGQADQFMNMYTEESSAVEREWMAKHKGNGVKEPLSPTLVTILTFLVTILAVALAIYFVV